MKKKLTALLLMCGMFIGGISMTQGYAAEILTEEDFIQKTVTEDKLVKTADNFIVLFDASSSMNEPYQKDKSVTKYDIARKILKERHAILPDLGYNAGLYLFTPIEDVYPMQPFNRAASAKAIDGLPAKAEGPTMLQKGLERIDPVLQGVSGRTVVFIFSDGTYTSLEGWDPPDVMAKQLSDKHNACFYVISSATTERAKKLLQGIASANECSRVVPFDAFIANPEYTTGALYTVKSTARVETITETKIVGMKIENILFDYDKSVIRPEFYSELKELGEFLQTKSNAYTVLNGYTDGRGSGEYNMRLSRRRAEGVADYLKTNFNIAPSRIVMNWYGKSNPVASNDTEEGRRLNRRVEVAVGLR